MRLAPIAVFAVAVLAVAACGRSRMTPAQTTVPDSSAAPATRTFSLEAAEATLWPDYRPVRFAASTAAERTAIETIVDALWRGVAEDGPEAPALAARAAEAGLRLERWRVGARVVWAIVEPATERRGAGVYLVRVGAPAVGASILLEAPHPFFDAGTELIAARLFLAEDAPPALRGMFAATAHRYQLEPNGDRTPRDGSPADLARASEHTFSAATVAATRAGATLVAQLHGFDADARDAGDVVVSAGRAPAPELVTRIADGLRPLGVDVRRWPDDTDALGATTNVQGRLVAAVGGAFVHLELAGPLRRRLQADAGARRTLIDALLGASGRGSPSP